MAVIDKIKRRLTGKRGWVFTPRDFLDLGSRAAVDQTLSRLARQGVIRRVDRGVYDYPRQHSKLGTMSPDIDQLAGAVAKKSGDTVFPSGAAAANILGLSTQVPARPTYMTSGATRVTRIGGRTIAFRHARTPILDGVPAKVNYTLQALAYLGKNGIDADLLKRCADQLDSRDVKALTGARLVVSGWMANAITKIEGLKYG
ncbi:hypothetical protein MMA231_04288 (plasmid) [Asticcacaulis sp. MM231]|uniref:DUF6088 family protein n=1 Tax=Asticcacaulis sp. MM231 TaxID=3157666 RepID=UPI0032D590FA